MKASIDRDLCIGCEVCADTCPHVFRMNDDGAGRSLRKPCPYRGRRCGKSCRKQLPSKHYHR